MSWKRLIGQRNGENIFIERTPCLIYVIGWCDFILALARHWSVIFYFIFDPESFVTTRRQLESQATHFQYFDTQKAYM